MSANVSLSATSKPFQAFGIQLGKPDATFPDLAGLIRFKSGKFEGFNGAIWVEFAGGGSASFMNPDPTTISVGGIAAGTTFPVPITLQQFGDLLLYPYQSPGFTSFSIQGVANPLEVGASIPASVTFLWGTSQPANVQTDSIDIIDVTGGNITLASGIANDGSEPIVMGGAITKTSAVSHSFRIQGINTQSGAFNTTSTYNWRWRGYWGVNAATVLSEAQIEALAGNGLVTGIAGTYSTGAGGYKYLCIPNVIGGQINSVKDQSTGLNVPMVLNTDHPSYSNVDGGGFYYALVSVTNSYGVTTNYRLYRTRNSLGGAVTLVVT